MRLGSSMYSLFRRSHFQLSSTMLKKRQAKDHHFECFRNWISSYSHQSTGRDSAHPVVHDHNTDRIGHDRISNALCRGEPSHHCQKSVIEHLWIAMSWLTRYSTLPLQKPSNFTFTFREHISQLAFSMLQWLRLTGLARLFSDVRSQHGALVDRNRIFAPSGHRTTLVWKYISKLFHHSIVIYEWVSQAWIFTSFRRNTYQLSVANWIFEIENQLVVQQNIPEE